MDIRKIAELTGFSKSTVSRAINDQSGIKESTKQKILKVIDELNYRPNQIAISLTTKKTRIIGVIISDIENPFYSRMIKGIGEVLEQFDYNMMIINTFNDLVKEKKAIDIMIGKKVDGIIFSAVEKNTKNIDLIINAGIPSVSLDLEHDKYREIDSVFSSQFKTAENATDYLIKNGHRKICLIYPPYDINKNNSDFCLGFISTMKKNNLNAGKDHIIGCHPSIMDGYRIGLEVFQKKDLTAVLTADIVAYGLYMAAEELGMKIPDDISIFGNDDLDFSKTLVPKLTTTFQPKRKAGKIAARLLLNKINDLYSSPKRIEMRPSITIRQSVKSIR